MYVIVCKNIQDVLFLFQKTVSVYSMIRNLKKERLYKHRIVNALLRNYITK